MEKKSISGESRLLATHVSGKVYSLPIELGTESTESHSPLTAAPASPPFSINEKLLVQALPWHFEVATA